MIAWLSLLSVIVLSASCVNEEYDMSNGKLNLEITPFQGGLSLPLGSTEQIRMKDLLSDANSDVLQVENGAYVVKYDGSFDMGDGLSSLKNHMNVNVPNMDFSQIITFRLEDVEDPGFVPDTPDHELIIDKVDAVISEKFEAELLPAGIFPKEIAALRSVHFEDAYIYLSLDAASILHHLGPADLSAEFDVKLPDFIRIAGNDSGHINLSGAADEKGLLSIPPVKVEGLDINMDAEGLEKGLKDFVSIEGTVTLSDLHIDSYEVLKDNLDLGFTICLMNGTETGENIDVDKVIARIDYRLDRVMQTMELREFNELFGSFGDDVNLDMNRAELSLDARTNLGIPVIADMEFVPYYDGMPDNGGKISANVHLDPSDSYETYVNTEYVFNEKDVLALVRRIPETLEIMIDPYTDSDKFSVIEPKAGYALDADYHLEIPLEFGPDFSLKFRETVQNLPEIMGSLLADGTKVMIGGSLQNSLPLGFDLEVNVLDIYGNVLPALEGTGVQKIAPCTMDGAASKTELGIVLALKKGVEAEDVASLELLFNADSEGAAGVPVKEDAYLQAALQLVLPEGITVDLQDTFDEIFSFDE